MRETIMSDGPEQDDWRRAVVTVGGGRGFVVEIELNRYVVTAAHCLPQLPPEAPAEIEDLMYAKLLGPLGAEPTVWAECVFVDPVADLAVLGSPDNQELWEEAEAYAALVDNAVPLPIGRLTFVPQHFTRPDGTVIDGPPVAESAASLLSLDRRWFTCQVTSLGRALWIKDAVEPIQGGMSGSPIVAPDGTAIGVACLSAGPDNLPHHEGGPNPVLATRLPGWMLQQ